QASRVETDPDVAGSILSERRRRGAVESLVRSERNEAATSTVKARQRLAADRTDPQAAGRVLPGPKHVVAAETMARRVDGQRLDAPEVVDTPHRRPVHQPFSGAEPPRSVAIVNDALIPSPAEEARAARPQ